MKYQRILLIDDDEDDHEIFAAAIGKVGAFEYVTLNNARMALDKLISGAVKADVIFLDLNMPIMNGPQFLGEIKQQERLRDIPVVILSTSSEQTAVAQARALGAQHFLSKPDKFEDWIAVLRSVLLG